MADQECNYTYSIFDKAEMMSFRLGVEGTARRREVFNQFRPVMERAGYEMTLSPQGRVQAIDFDASDAVLFGVYTYVTATAREQLNNENAMKEQWHKMSPQR